MASLTRKFLTALGIEEEKADQILDTHQSVLNEIKTERDELKEKAEKADKIQTKLDEANEEIKTLKENQGEDAYKSKYEDLKQKFDDYKADIDKKAVLSSKDKAYRALLKEAKVSDRRIDSIMKLTNLEELELDGDKLKDADKLKESIAEEWADFIVEDDQSGADLENPPAGKNKTPNLDGLSFEDYVKARKSK